MSTRFINKKLDKKIVFIGGGDVLDGKQDDLFISLFKEYGSEKVRLLYLPFALFKDDKKIASMSKYMTLLKKYFSKLNKNIDFVWVQKDDKRSLVVNKIKQADIVFLSGGDTNFLIDYLRKSKFEEELINFYSQGKLIIGNSAGCLAISSQGVSLHEGEFKKYQGIGIINNFAPVVHYYEHDKSELNSYLQKISNKTPVYLKENNACLILNDKKLIKISK